MRDVKVNALECQQPARCKYLYFAMLPFGGHKGFGIGMVVDLMTGVLSGGACAKHVKRQRPNPGEVSGSCHTIISLDFTPFMPIDEFIASVQDWLASIKNSKKAEGFSEILIPGEKEMRAKRDRKKGIPLSPGMFAKRKIIHDQYHLAIL